MTYEKENNILIEKYKCIFYFIHKNGSTSTFSMIVDELGMEKGPNYQNHLHKVDEFPFPFVKKSELNTVYKDYLRFCFVRNPWDRLVSCYRDKIRPGHDDGVQPVFRNFSPLFYDNMSFEAFVNVVCSIPDEKADPHFASQIYRITNPSGMLGVNFIGNVERMEESQKEITNLTGFPFQNTRLNKTKGKKNYGEYYNEELVEKVRRRYFLDVKLFNYEFGEKPAPPVIGCINEDFLDKAFEDDPVFSFFKKRNQMLSRVVQAQDKKIHDLKSSVSWKITAPLRKISEWLPF